MKDNLLWFIFFQFPGRAFDLFFQSPKVTMQITDILSQTGIMTEHTMTFAKWYFKFYLKRLLFHTLDQPSLSA